ncbi:hypothetical protein B0H34DRAFT_738022 [Crassisporium funariophilum]|nr:hypothetical protein B0H34DRAFT_738022 [Crassisporium funariophilum]
MDGSQSASRLCSDHQSLVGGGDDQAEFYKRKISALKDTLNRREGERRAKRSKSSSQTKPGRGIQKVVDLYHDLVDLLEKADKHAAEVTLDPTELEEINAIDFLGFKEEEIDNERKDRKRCHVRLRLLNTLIPGFQDNIDKTEYLATFLAPLQQGANDARSHDTIVLRRAVADWLNHRIPSPIPPLSSLSKADRGTTNDITGRLLCPVDYKWDDPEVRANLRNMAPGFDFASSFFLRYLYENESGDPESPDIGFLKGPLVVRAYRLIFTSPSSAGNENDASEVTSRRRDVATSLRLNGHVTVRSVVYAATQLVFSLNDSREWKHVYAGLHYPSLYNFIVDFFELPEDPASKLNITCLLQWWNRKIFPTTPGRSSTSVPRTAMVGSQKRLDKARARRAHTTERA